MKFLKQLTVLLVTLCFAAVSASGADLDDARQLFKSGKYAECIES